MRSWLVVPAVAVVAAVAALALHGAWLAPCAAAAAAAIAQAVRVLAAPSPAAIAGACCAALLAAASISDPRALVALAGAAWTIALLAAPPAPRPARRSLAELTRPPPAVVMLPAVIAAVLAPACIALVPIAAARLPRQPRWLIVAPIAGVIAALVAIAVGMSPGGGWWFGSPRAPVSLPHSLALLGDALGPLLAVAALAGLVLLARRVPVIACVAGALLVDVRAGAPGALTLGLAGLCAGISVGRLGAMIRIPSGQAVVAATCAAILLLPPTWLAFSG